MPDANLPYRRILLKLSGEALLGNSEFGIDPAFLNDLAADIRVMIDEDIQVALVIGGGNLFRGVQLAESGMDRVTADQMGMLATVMNSLARSAGRR